MKKLIKFALVIGAITAASKLVRAKRSEWEGLTETEIRDKIDSKMPERVPDEKREAVKEKVVAGMRAAGKLAEEESADSAE